MKKGLQAIAADNNIDFLNFPSLILGRVMILKKKEIHIPRLFFQKSRRKGFNYYESKKMMRDRNYYGCMMVETGDADAMISGLSKNYPDTIRPALQIIGKEEDVKKIAGMYIMLTKKGPLFLADTTVNFNPTAEELADITIMVAREVKQFQHYTPYCHVKLFKFRQQQFAGSRTGGGSNSHRKKTNPDLIVDGEMQASMAFNKEILKDNYPFSELVDQEVNT